MASPSWQQSDPQPQYPVPYDPQGQYSLGDGAGGPDDMGSGQDKEMYAPYAAAAAMEGRKTAFHRGAMGAAEALGARLSIDPSMKIPQNDPASGMTLSNTRMVQPTTEGRSGGNFFQGMSQLDQV